LKVLTTKKVLEAVGYRTSCMFVHTSNEISKERNDQRIKAGSKTINEDVRIQKYNFSVINAEAFKEHFEAFWLVDNSGPIIEEHVETINGELEGFFEGSPQLDAQVEAFVATLAQGIADNAPITEAKEGGFSKYRKDKPKQAVKPPVVMSDQRAGDGMSATATLALEGRVIKRTIKRFQPKIKSKSGGMLKETK
jgi:hypothetical protein